MDVDEDDDFYAPEDDATEDKEEESGETAQPASKPEQEDEDLEEGEEEDEAGSEGSDSDIDIITERKDGSKPAPPATQPRYNEIRNIPQRTTSSDVTTKPPLAKKEANKNTPQPSGADLPGISTSKIDIDGKPIYEPAGKPITQVNIDLDLPDNDKPWRRPGTDVSDYFNYGFDEFTWALYSSKQDSLRAEYSQERIAENNKKMFEDMNMMMAMGAMPGMMTGASGGAAMPGMEGIPPEMQQMMQQMMASGVDPSQMDPAMFASMQGAQAGAGSAAGASTGNQAQGFGGQGGFGQGQNQYGYEQGMMGSGDTRNRGGGGGGGNFRGRGKGRW